VKAPNFTPDAQWIDTVGAGTKVPHSMKGYPGHVLLIDSWEYSCINCIRDFRILKRWYAKYHAAGFNIVGVHYGEFAMGFNADNVRDAAKRFELPWPVVADLHGSIWFSRAAKGISCESMRSCRRRAWICRIRP
jgi:thiol-disulfide isomerase/thioredoxin